MRALIAAHVEITVIRVSPREPVAKRYTDRDDQEQHQLLRVDEAGPRIDRERRGHERDRGIGGQRPEETRRLEPLVPRQQQPEPADHGDRQEDLRRGDRELQRTGDAGNGDEAGGLEAGPVQPCDVSTCAVGSAAIAPSMVGPS